MKICNHCQAIMLDNEKICPNCGRKEKEKIEKDDDEDEVMTTTEIKVIRDE